MSSPFWRVWLYTKYSDSSTKRGLNKKTHKKRNAPFSPSNAESRQGEHITYFLRDLGLDQTHVPQRRTPELTGQPSTWKGHHPVLEDAVYHRYTQLPIPIR